jgi:hypothetical protein
MKVATVHRRLAVRLQEALPAEKVGNDYRIPVTSLISALEGGSQAGWRRPS